MPISVREQVIAALHAALAASLGGVTVERNRTTPVQKYPSVVVIDGGQSVDYELTGFARFDLQVTVEGHAQAVDAAALGPAINDLAARCVQAILATGDLGGLAADLREGDLAVDIDRENAGTPTGAFAQAILVQYWTKAGDPYVLSPP